MGELTWRNVDNPDFGRAIEGVNNATKLLNQGLQSGISGLDRYQDIRTQNADKSIEMQKMAFQDPAAYKQAMLDGSLMGNDQANASAAAIAGIDTQLGVLQKRDWDIQKQGIEGEAGTRLRVDDEQKQASQLRMAAASSDIQNVMIQARNGNQKGASDLLAKSELINALTPEEKYTLFTHLGEVGMKDANIKAFMAQVDRDKASAANTRVGTAKTLRDDAESKNEKALRARAVKELTIFRTDPTKVGSNFFNGADERFRKGEISSEYYAVLEKVAKEYGQVQQSAVSAAAPINIYDPNSGATADSLLKSALVTSQQATANAANNDDFILNKLETDKDKSPIETVIKDLRASGNRSFNDINDDNLNTELTRIKRELGPNTSWRTAGEALKKAAEAPGFFRSLNNLVWSPFGYTPKVVIDEDKLAPYKASNPQVAVTQNNVAFAKQREAVITDQQAKLEAARVKADSFRKLAAQNATYNVAAATAEAEFKQQQLRSQQLTTSVDMDGSATKLPTHVAVAQERLGKIAQLEKRMNQTLPKKTNLASYEERARVEADRAKATAEYNALTEKERKGTQRVEDIQKATANNKRRKALFDAALQTWKDNGQKGRRPKLADIK